MANHAIKTLLSRNLRDNRTKNRVAILAIALTSILFTTVFTVGVSMLQSAAMVGAGMAGAQGMMAFAAVLALIIGSGYLIIYNIFQISVTREIHYYGRLKTLGATRGQIRHMVFSQAFRLSLIGIPIGLVAGFGIGAVLMPIVLVSMGSAAVLSANPVIFLLAALFSLVTVLLSCAKPAAIAGKVSPVAAVTYTDSDVSPKKKTKRTAHNTSPRKMARNNMKRNPKRTALVVLSISIGIALVNSFYVYHHSFDQNAYVEGYIQSDVAVMAVSHPDNEKEPVSGEITSDMLNAMAQTPGVTQASGVWYAETQAALNPSVQKRLTTYYEEPDSGQSGWLEMEEDASRQYKALKQTGQTTVSVYGMDAYAAGMGNVYLGEFDAGLFSTGNYALGYGIADNGEGSVHYEVGDTIEIGSRQYELMALIDPPSTLKGELHSANNKLEIDYVIPAANFRESFPQAGAVSAFLETTDDEARNSVVRSLSEAYPGATVHSRLTYEANFQAQTLAISAMGYVLGFVMAMIGILNFANTMITAIVARKHEFTMLESIGMTKRQLKKMLVFEGIHYVGLSLILSLAGSVFIAATVVEEAVSTSWVASYSFSLAPFAVLVPILLLLAVVIPVACFRGTQSESLVERLRSA